MNTPRKFSKDIHADPDGYYMSIPEVAAIHVAQQLSNFQSAVELCSAVGMMVIQLAKFIPLVRGVELDARRVEDARKNAELYGVSSKAIFIQGDVLDKVLLQSIKAEVAVLDPDWSSSGEVKNNHTIDLDQMQPSLRTMMELTRQCVTTNTVSRVPKEFTLETMQEFGPYRLESIYIDDRLKFKVAYFLPDIHQSEVKEVYLSSLY